MKRRALFSLLWAGWLAACAPETASDATSGEDRDLAPAVAASRVTTPTEYATDLLFLPLTSSGTRALVLQLANTATAGTLQHRYLGWQLTRRGWQNVLDIDTVDASNREPWRLLPVASLRLTVTAEGDPDALILAGGPSSYTLDLGDRLDAWEDRSGTRHEIREAIWIDRGQRLSGLAVQHRYAVPGPRLPGRFGPYDRALLRSQDDAVIVLYAARTADTHGDSYAWMYADGLTRRWTTVETRTVEVVNAAQLRRNVPVRLWFRIPEPEIKGELVALERRFNELATPSGPKPYNGLYRVRGWIEFAGQRRTVEGMLERAEP